MTSKTINTTLEQLRTSIDNIDTALICLLAERFRTTQKVGEFKALNKLPASDKERETQQIIRLHQLAKNVDLDPDFAERFFSFIVNEVVHNHELLSEKNKKYKE